MHAAQGATAGQVPVNGLVNPPAVYAVGGGQAYVPQYVDVAQIAPQYVDVAQIAAFGKGGSGGKGFGKPPTCANCGYPNHNTMNCRAAGGHMDSNPQTRRDWSTGVPVGPRGGGGQQGGRGNGGYGGQGSNKGGKGKRDKW